MDNRDPRQALLERFVSHLPLGTTDQTLVILKGHLLVEELLREYVHGQFSLPEHLSDARLTFQQCLCLAKASDTDQSRDKLWLLVGKLNALRNKLAHNLEPRDIDSALKEFVGIQSDFNPNDLFADKESNFGVLATCILGICMSLSYVVHPIGRAPGDSRAAP